MRLWVFSAVAVTISLSGSATFAQQRTVNNGTKLEFRRGAEGSRLSVNAREQMTAGKWGPAISLFDRAADLSIDPTLRRDRGICHDKLDQPYPAMDDYRAYLTARPDAPDAQRIADRLSELQEATGVAKGHLTAAPLQARIAAESQTAATDDSVSGASAGEADALRAEANGRGSNYDKVSQRADDATASADSPLRGGTGFILGPFFDLRWGTNGGGDPLYGFGVSPRYSMSRMFTLGAEVGFVGTGSVGTATAASGARGLVFVEGRIPLNDRLSDAFLVSVGAGYERYDQSSTRISLNAPQVRGRIGYRHVFGSRIGLEVGGTADVLFFSFDNLPVGGVGASSTDVYLGTFAALTVGF